MLHPLGVKRKLQKVNFPERCIFPDTIHKRTKKVESDSSQKVLKLLHIPCLNKIYCVYLQSISRFKHFKAPKRFYQLHRVVRFASTICDFSKQKSLEMSIVSKTVSSVQTCNLLRSNVQKNSNLHAGYFCHTNCNLCQPNRSVWLEDTCSCNLDDL